MEPGRRGLGTVDHLMTRILAALLLFCALSVFGSDLPILRHFGTTNDWPTVAGALTNRLVNTNELVNLTNRLAHTNTVIINNGGYGTNITLRGATTVSNLNVIGGLLNLTTGAQWTNTVRWDSDYGFQNDSGAWCYTLTNPVWAGEFRVPDTYRSVVITNSLVTATSLIVPFVCEMADGLTWIRQPGIGARTAGYFTLEFGAIADANPNWVGFLLLKP